MDWIEFKVRRPERNARQGFLVLVDGMTQPLVADYNTVAKRFEVTIPAYGKFQVPVTHWCCIPPLP